MQASRRDYYAALGILRESTPEEIKRAYYSAARRFHPDQNMLPGETEMFLEVQRAYEVLSNPERRAKYDATLPEVDPDTIAPVRIHVDYSRHSLVRLDEPQLIYALFEAAPPGGPGKEVIAPLNMCLVLDRSTSMQGEKLDVAKATAVRIVQMLRPEDLFALVVFSDRAEVFLPSAFQSDLKRAQSRIQSIQASGATEIFQGLSAGLNELRRNRDPRRGSHLILLTDGHTYGDEQQCLQLAEEAARLNISISGFGIGGEWNDIFLDSLVGRTGGNSTYIAQPQDIQQMLVQKFAALARTVVDDAILEFQPQSGIQLRSCHRLQPDAGPVEIAQELHLGPILQDERLSVLFEFLVESAASKTESIVLLEGYVRAVVAARPIPFPPIPLRMERPSGTSASQQLPPQSIVSALAKLSLYRLQERARHETEAGEFELATRHLRHLALQLQAQGHEDLSKTAILEAESIERMQSFSEEGSKAIKYGTRALMQAPSGSRE
ncbi:MAG TPA: DnaJ domain-containing protein [Anaerolineales bacterium]